MLAISEIAPSGQQSSATQMQTHLIASIATAQRVAAAKAGDQSSDAGMQSPGGRPDSAKLLREAVQKSSLQRAKAETETAEPKQEAVQKNSEATTRSIIEAQEQTKTASKLTAAFQARYAITDLLSVIRDPEDQLLPMAPSEDAA